MHAPHVFYASLYAVPSRRSAPRHHGSQVHFDWLCEHMSLAAAHVVRAEKTPKPGGK
jgi:hypothetical protein